MEMPSRTPLAVRREIPSLEIPGNIGNPDAYDFVVIS